MSSPPIPRDRLITEHYGALRSFAARALGRGSRLDPERITVSALPGESGPSLELDLLALDEALVELEAIDERWARGVELRFFGGLTSDEVANALDLSRRTVTRDWDLARVWLKRRLS